MAELRNVIVVSIGSRRYAAELRWIREVISLGFVTDVPTAPAAIAGVCNLRGNVLPVLEIPNLLGGETPDAAPRRSARQGDGALVIDVEGHLVAFRVDRVDRVVSLQCVDGMAQAPGGDSLALLDPGVLVRRALEIVARPAATVVHGG